MGRGLLSNKAIYKIVEPKPAFHFDPELGSFSLFIPDLCYFTPKPTYVICSYLLCLKKKNYNKKTCGLFLYLAMGIYKQYGR